MKKELDNSKEMQKFKDKYRLHKRRLNGWLLNLHLLFMFIMVVAEEEAFVQLCETD
jgi:hypothetical protein